MEQNWTLLDTAPFKFCQENQCVFHRKLHDPKRVMIDLNQEDAAIRDLPVGYSGRVGRVGRLHRSEKVALGTEANTARSVDGPKRRGRDHLRYRPMFDGGAPNTSFPKFRSSRKPNPYVARKPLRMTASGVAIQLVPMMM